MDHVVIVLGCSEGLPITILKYNVTLPTLAYPFLVTSFFVPASEVGQWLRPDPFHSSGFWDLSGEGHAIQTRQLKIWSLLAHYCCLTFMVIDLLFCLERCLWLVLIYRSFCWEGNSLILKLKANSVNQNLHCQQEEHVEVEAENTLWWTNDGLWKGAVLPVLLKTFLNVSKPHL